MLIFMSNEENIIFQNTQNVHLPIFVFVTIVCKGSARQLPINGNNEVFQTFFNHTVQPKGKTGSSSSKL